MAKINEKFIVNLKGKDFVTYEGLLDLAHQEGLSSIEVELLQIPFKENGDIAIAKATVKAKDKTFVDIGDAGPNSTNSMIRPHIIRMASTRAKARALRDLTNVSMTAIEELGDEKEDKPTNRSNGNKKATTKANKNADEDKQAIIDGSLASDKQLKYMYVLAQKKGFTEQMPGYIKTTYNRNSSKALTKKEASEIINELQEIGGDDLPDALK